MSITIDQAGRVVILKAIRDQLHLVAGSELEVDASGTEIRLRVADLEPSLIQKRGLLRARAAPSSQTWKSPTFFTMKETGVPLRLRRRLQLRPALQLQPS